ncbi:ankyrin repeat domain-containing protein [Pararhizobium sp. IMCC21322]|uniref:ankyrin repeat domain-containing protein n=1 Tax=Pararhizobium sp. IMCC21322 TaxID=3067903 RepID=UPI002740A84D|nr:ankyrin repeat domain-containing protein [Pararhizobium sp. IMCC21322]
MNSIFRKFAVAVATCITATVSYGGPLHTAIQKGDLDQVKLEIANGADVTEQDMFLGGALLLAIVQGNVQIIELLISHGVSIEAADVTTGTVPLHAAAVHGNLSVVKILIKNGANIDAVRASDGETVLHAAAEGGNGEVVELLISLGADVNARSKYDNAPIHSAAASDHMEVVKLLRANGAVARPIDPIAPQMHLADSDAGASIFPVVCGRCHTVDNGGPSVHGPNLWNIVGKKIGSHPGYNYSSALIRHEGVWTNEALFAFITRPTDFIPGTKMISMGRHGYRGVKDRRQRANIIAYLLQLSNNPTNLISP